MAIPPKTEEIQESRQSPSGQPEENQIDEAITSLRDSSAKHREYVGQLFEMLNRKRLDKLREMGVERVDTTPEFAALGMLVAAAIFDHLVIANRDALDAGSCGERSNTRESRSRCLVRPFSRRGVELATNSSSGSL